MFDKKIKLGYYIWSKDGDFMIFSSDFDRTLWLMLISDKKNRKDIAEFIRNVPNDLYDRIHQELIKCLYYDVKDKMSIKKITKAFRDTVSVSAGMIILNLTIWNNLVNGSQDVTQITLYPLTLEQIKTGDSINPEYIGDFYHTYSTYSLLFNTVIASGVDMGYEILDNDKDYIIIQSVDGKFEKNIFIGDIPNEINLSDFMDKARINKLVKIRRER